AFFSPDGGRVVVQVPAFGKRFWVYALYDARTDQFAKVGQPYRTKPGFYLLVGPTWKGDTPDGIAKVIHCSTDLANLIPRVFLDDTAEDRAAIQPVINQVVAYPLREYDGSLKTMEWTTAPTIPGRQPAGGGETKWVVPEKFFDDFGEVLESVPALPGEEALYGQFRALMDVRAKDGVIKQALDHVAVATEREV